MEVAALRVAISTSSALSRRLVVGALGVCLVLLVTITWGSGLFYLAVRLDLPVSVNVAVTDAVHTYAGVAAVCYFGAKLVRVGLRRRVWGVPKLLLWQRWISWALACLYGAIFLTGGLLLLPIRGSVYQQLVNAHLLTSVWAVPLTTWHVLHYRARALPFLPRWRPVRIPARFWAGVLLTIVPVVGFALAPRALSQLSQLSQLRAGPRWQQAGIAGSPVSAVPPIGRDGALVAAAGAGLYVGDAGGDWSRVTLPSGLDDQVLALGADAGGRVFAGTAGGLFTAAAARGPYRPLAFPDGLVRSLAVAPTPSSLWAVGDSGPWLSSDGGQSWAQHTLGLRDPAYLGPIAWFDGTAYVADDAAVYRWDETSGSWKAVADLAFVSSLDPDTARDRLFAVSRQEGAVRVMEGGRWRPIQALSAVYPYAGKAGMAGMTMSGGHAAHSTHGGIASSVNGGVTDAFGSLFAAGTSDGVSASGDGGQTWTALADGLPSDAIVNQLVPAGADRLVAATSDGVYEYRLAPYQPATGGWWIVLLAVVVVASVTGIALTALRRGRQGG